MNLTTAACGREYIIKSVATNDAELDRFLFSLGFYAGEPISVIFRKNKICVVSVKSSKYSIDDALAAAIKVFD